MTLSIKQNDTSPSIKATLTDSGGSPVNLNAASVNFHMSSIEGEIKVIAPVAITNPPVGEIEYEWQVGDTDTVGTYYIEFEATYADGTVETFPNNGYQAVTIVRSLA